MSAANKQVYDRVYWRGENESLAVRTRAAALGKPVSTYIRDLVVLDLHLANLKPLMDTSENRARYRDAVRKGMEDPSGYAFGEDPTPRFGNRPPLTDEAIEQARADVNAEEAESKRLLEEFKKGL